jgi:hypothetical protein
MLLHHDNKTAHMSLKTTEFVTNNNTVIIPHSPYFPDLVPCDFALSLKLKMKLKGWCFQTESDIQRESQMVPNINLGKWLPWCFWCVEKNDGIAVYISKGTILKEMAAKTE